MFPLEPLFPFHTFVKKGVCLIWHTVFYPLGNSTPSGDGSGYVIGECNGRICVFNKSAIKTCSGPYQRHADDKCLTGDRTCSSSMQQHAAGT